MVPNCPFVICITVETYFLEKRCSKETKITDTEECKTACKHMGLPLSNRPFKNKKPCYKDGLGVCNQKGGMGKLAKMICKNKGSFYLLR